MKPTPEVNALIFSGRKDDLNGGSHLNNANALVFEGGQREKSSELGKEAAAKSKENLDILNAVWERLKKSEWIPFLKQTLPPQKESIEKIMKTLSTKEINKNHCKILENGKAKLSVVRNEQGHLGFVTQSHDGEGIAPITLMIACARCTVELELEERIKGYIKKNYSDSDASRLSAEEKNKIREEIIHSHPRLFHFTIDRCANAHDVAIMLSEMHNGKPKLTATLTEEVIAIVKKDMENPKTSLTTEQKNILNQQIANQEKSKANVSPKP